MAIIISSNCNVLLNVSLRQDLGFRSQAFWGRDWVFDMSLYNANTDIRASKCNYKTSNKLVLQLGTRDRLHLLLLLFFSSSRRKKESKLFGLCCFCNPQPSSAELWNSLYSLYHSFLRWLANLLVIYMPGVKLKLRVKVESGRVPKICKSGAAEHLSFIILQLPSPTANCPELPGYISPIRSNLASVDNQSWQIQQWTSLPDCYFTFKKSYREKKEKKKKSAWKRASKPLLELRHKAANVHTREGIFCQERCSRMQRAGGEQARYRNPSLTGALRNTALMHG